MKKQRKELSRVEEILSYEVLSEKIDQEKGCKIVDIKTYWGTTARLFMPIHTQEEEAEVGAEITRAMFKMCFPNEDWSNTKLYILV